MREQTSTMAKVCDKSSEEITSEEQENLERAVQEQLEAREEAEKLTFILPGINKKVINAVAANKRKSDSQLLSMARQWLETEKQEQEARSRLNPIVQKKRSLEKEVVQQLVAAGYRGFTDGEGTMFSLMERRMDAPNQDELRAAYQEIGLTDEQIADVNRVQRICNRFKYDLVASLPVANDA